jgi:hypothetical protein
MAKFLGPNEMSLQTFNSRRTHAMQPPSPGRDLGLIRSIVAANPGQTLKELALSSGYWTSELVPSLRQLVDLGEIRREGAAFYPRDRRRKRKPKAPTGWRARLAGWIGG